MAIKNIKCADFSDVFDWAVEKKLAGWNECCDIFHRTEFFNYKGQSEFNLNELESNIESGDWYGSEVTKAKWFKATEIMIAWMKENKLKNITIFGD